MTKTRRANCILAALALAALAPAASGCRDEAPTLVLRTSPPDAEVAVDGYVHPGGSPHDIRFKAPGRYGLAVRKDGYRPLEMIVTLANGERRAEAVELVPEGPKIATDPPVLQEPPSYPPLEPPPPARTFSVRISSVPAGAEVSLRDPGSPSVRRAGTTPLTVDLPAFGATEVSLTMPGYAPHRRLVVPPASGNDVLLDVALSREGTGPKPPIFDDPLLPFVADDPTAPSYGFLSVATSPWTAVYVDGAAAGNTPITDLRVSSGRHSVVMENRDLGVRRKTEITVRAGEHVRLTEQLN
jgi:eukaryotic-like serine/threonine-protein kinase